MPNYQNYIAHCRNKCTLTHWSTCMFFEWLWWLGAHAQAVKQRSKDRFCVRAGLRRGLMRLMRKGFWPTVSTYIQAIYIYVYILLRCCHGTKSQTPILGYINMIGIRIFVCVSFRVMIRGCLCHVSFQNKQENRGHKRLQIYCHVTLLAAYDVKSFML